MQISRRGKSIKVLLMLGHCHLVLWNRGIKILGSIGQSSSRNYQICAMNSTTELLPTGGNENILSLSCNETHCLYFTKKNYFSNITLKHSGKFKFQKKIKYLLETRIHLSALDA